MLQFDFIAVIAAPGSKGCGETLSLPGVQEFRSGYTVSIKYMNDLSNLYYLANASSHLAVTKILHQIFTNLHTVSLVETGPKKSR